MEIAFGSGAAAKIEIAALAGVLKDIGIVAELICLAFSWAFKGNSLNEFAGLNFQDSRLGRGIHELMGKGYRCSFRAVSVSGAGACW